VPTRLAQTARPGPSARPSETLRATVPPAVSALPSHARGLAAASLVPASDATICVLWLSDVYLDVTTIDLTTMGAPPSQILAGTLDLLILKTLSAGPFHGYGLAQHIKRLSRDALRVEEGSLYPALQRMQAKGWIASELKKSPTGRTARYYKLTAAGRRQLGEEESDFERAVAATMRVLKGAAP
jgi:PadR family transcriptional regulator